VFHDIFFSEIVLWTVITLFGFVVVYALFLLPTWFSFLWIAYFEFNGRVTQEGVAVFSKRKKGSVCFYNWNEIETIKTIFEPPILYSRIILKNGKSVDLKAANIKNFKENISKIKKDFLFSCIRMSR